MPVSDSNWNACSSMYIASPKEQAEGMQTFDSSCKRRGRNGIKPEVQSFYS